MKKNRLYYWNPVKRYYGHIESGKALGKPAFYAVYEGMKKWNETLDGAIEELTRAGYEPNGFIDGDCRRYSLPLYELNDIYKWLEEFVADCTEQEYRENKEHIIAVYTLLHRHINAETYK